MTTDETSAPTEARQQLLDAWLSNPRGALPTDRIPRVPRSTPVPLSFGQRQLWVLDQLTPHSTEYLMSIELRLRGAVHVTALRRALDALVARHEVLRTRYVLTDGEVLQVIDAPTPVNLVEHDLAKVPVEVRRDRSAEIVEAEVSRPFDLQTGPMLRVTLIRQSADEHLLVICVHHIASDGWSEDVLLRELNEYYTAFLADRPAALPPLPVQYADFAVWQREQAAGDSMRAQLDYWRDKLAGLPALDLPTDRPRSTVRGVDGAQVEFTLPADEVTPLRSLAKAQGSTLFTVLVSAFQLLLSRYTGQTSVAVGTPVDGRDRVELQPMVGYLLNTLVLRTELDERDSFVDLLAAVRQTVLEAHANKDVPFALVVDAVAPQRDSARNPLFQAMLLLDHGPAAPPRLADLDVWRQPSSSVMAKFELTLWFVDRPDGSLDGGFVYPTALFEAPTVQRMADHVQQLLRAIGVDPHAAIGDLDMLTEAERRELLDYWTATDAGYPDGECLHDLVAAQVARTPEAIAVVAGERTLTYSQLDRDADRIAHRLVAHGIGPESVVGVCLHRGADLFVALLGVLKAGAAYLPLDPDHPLSRLRYLVEDSSTSVTIAGDSTNGLAGDLGVELIQVADGADRRTGPPPRTVRPDNAAYVIYTSGSTGRPKGVVIDHRGIVNRIRWMRDRFPHREGDRVLHKTALGFDVSVWEIFLPLVTGATLVAAEPGGHRDPRYLAQLIAESAITTVHFVPSMLSAFLANPLPAMPALRHVVCSGEALDPGQVRDFAAKLPCELHNLYGPTEASVDVTAARCVAGEPVVIGRPIANTRVYVCDSSLRPVPVGVPGQLCLAGVQLARGYLGLPGLTATAFVPDPFATEPGRRLYLTGDLARWRSDGTIEYLGRIDDQVKISGNRIEPGEIEAVLRTHPAVQTAVITARGDRGRQRLVAYVVSTPTGPLDVESMRAHLRTRLPDYMVPATWVPLAELPRTSSGKVDRKSLPVPVPAANGGSDRVEPRTEVERLIADAWAGAVGTPSPGVHDNFFGVGGDSIRAIRLVGALRASGFDLAVQDIFTHQTIADLAQLASSGDGGQLADSARTTLVRPFELLTAQDADRLPDGLVDAYPVGQIQAGMLYEMHAGRDAPNYQNVSCYSVRDELPFELRALRVAAQQVVDRHEVLRTSFDLTGYSEPLQLVHATALVDVGFTDLRGITPEEQKRALERFHAGCKGRQFDVAKAPLIRYHAHQVSDEEWWLTHIECHAVLDGWSHTSVIDELVSAYRAVRSATPQRPWHPPRVRYADFVAAERQAVNSPSDRAFWHDRIRDLSGVRLPGSWRTAEHDRAWHKVCVPFGDIEARLRELAGEAEVSLKSVLLTAHLKALGIVTGQSRFFTGLVCNGRPERDRGDEVRGMYLNTVPFCADVTAPSWRVLLRRTFAEEAALWPHRRYPLPVMQREWGRHGEPLIETMFTHLDFHVIEFGASGVVPLSDFSPSELGLEVWTFPGELWLGCGFGRMTRTELDFLARTHRQVLDTMVAGLDGDPATCGLHPDDRHRLLAMAQGTAVHLPPEECLHHLFERQASVTPESTAVIAGDHSVSYAELNRDANRLAHRLRRLGVGPDHVVGLYLGRGRDLITALLAVLKAGGAYLPLDPDYPENRLRYMLTDADARIVLAAGRIPSALRDNLTVLHVHDAEDMPVHNPESRVTQDNLAYVIYTSGSTGRPKGVAIPHRGPVNLAIAQRATFDIGPDDRILQFVSPSFDVSVWDILLALANGAALVLLPEGTHPADRSGVSTGLTHIALSPSVLARWAPQDFPGLRVCVSLGEPCPAGLAERWAADTRFVNAYGPTEITVIATVADVATGPLNRPPSIGRPITNTQAYLLDTDLEPVAAGVPAELYVGGFGVARGYLGRPEQTAAAFVPDPYSAEPGARLYRTGDLAFWNTDSTIQYVGRRDKQVKLRGFRVELGEVEAALDEHPSVEQTIAVVHDHQGDQRLVAYIRGLGGTRPTIVELRDHAKKLLPEHMVPNHYVMVDDFPLTTSGKVDRGALPAPGGGRPELAADYVAPRTATERLIAGAWADVLGVDRVGVHDDFFELGGHSLAVMRISAVLQEQHGITVPFRWFVEQRSVAGLAVKAGTEAEAGSREQRSLVWHRRTGTRPPLFCVHPGGGSAHWYRHLAERLHPEQPLAAFEWVNPDPSVRRPVSVQSVAARYVAELRQVQPVGPYRLLSWCGGGGFAGEMVRQLHDAGEHTTFILIDPAVDDSTRENAWRDLAMMQRCSLLFDMLNDSPSGERADQLRTEALDLLNSLVDEVDDEKGVQLPAEGAGVEWPQALGVWTEVMQTSLAYRHKPYPGVLHLVIGDELAKGEHEVSFGQSFDDYLARWRQLAPDGLRTYRVGGDHFGVLRAPHVDGLARLVTELLAGNHDAEAR